MTRVIIKINIDQIVEIERPHSEVEISTNRTIGVYNNISILIEIALGESISEKSKIIDVRFLEVDMKVITEMTTLEELVAGLGKDNIQVIIAEMIEVVVVGQDQVQEPVLTMTELDVLSVGNMIILLKSV